MDVANQKTADRLFLVGLIPEITHPEFAPRRAAHARTAEFSDQGTGWIPQADRHIRHLQSRVRRAGLAGQRSGEWTDQSAASDHFEETDADSLRMPRASGRLACFLSEKAGWVLPFGRGSVRRRWKETRLLKEQDSVIGRRIVVF